MKFVFSKALCPEAMSLVENHADIYIADDGNPNNYLHEMKDADAFILRIGKMDARAIANSPNLKVIGRTGVGYDNVDIKAATAAGIPVIITPGANTRSVAEHTVALMLALSKNIVETQLETKKGNFTAIRDSGKTFEVLDKTIGIIGMGAIGRETARICRALGMRILGYDPYMTREQMMENTECTCYTDLSRMLPECDFISLHVPFSPATKNMIGGKELSLMKETSCIINCARGGIIDETALMDALNRGIIAGAGIDVFSSEPPNPEDPLLNTKNLIFTPHSAAMTREAVVRMGVMCAQGCLSILRGEKYPHIVNPEALEHCR